MQPCGVTGEKLLSSTLLDQSTANWYTYFNWVWRWVRDMVKFGTSSAFRRWVRVRVFGYGFGVRGRKFKSRDCALASDLVRAAYLLFLGRLCHNGSGHDQPCPDAIAQIIIHAFTTHSKTHFESHPTCTRTL